MKSTLLLTTLIVAYFSFHQSVSFAKSTDFTPAELIESLEPSYPREKYADRGGIQNTDSGLVSLEYMVNQEGRADEIIVTDSSNTMFNEEALKAVQRALFKPARSNGKVTPSRHSSVVEFEFSALDRQDSRGSTSRVGIKRVKGLPDRYSSFYEKFNEEMQRSSPNKKKASSLIKKMELIKHQNFYSLAYLSLAKFRFDEKFGSLEQRADSLRDLIAFDARVKEKYKILKDDMELTVLAGLLKLEIESGHFAEAISTYHKFSPDNESLKSMFANSIAKIEAIQSNADAVTERKISIGDSGYTHLPLLKNSFAFEGVEGTIKDLKLRCDTQFARLPYQQDGQYDIPSKWGHCHLQVLGSEGTTAILLEQ